MQPEKIGDDLEVGTELPDVEVEIVDDTPEDDRGREPLKAEKPEVEHEEELENYSERVQKRINQLNHRYHDERRAREALERQAEEAIRLAQTVYQENEKLKKTLTWGQQEYTRESEAKIDYAQKLAEDKYRRAYETGDTEGVLEAQKALNDVAIQRSQLQTWVNNAAQVQQEAETSLQQPQNQVYNAPVQQAQPSAPPRDPRAEDWAARNPWFGRDEEMTSFAYGLHQKLVNSGIDPTSDEYYQRIDNRIREKFPENFQKARKTSTVAPAARSTGSRKVTLTASQVAIAKRLGVPLETYAKYAAKEAQING